MILCPAIWDNRYIFHTATFDYLDGSYGKHFGHRAVGLIERPYLYPNGTSREALAMAPGAQRVKQLRVGFNG